jgi:beta-galactosidase GanA
MPKDAGGHGSNPGAHAGGVSALPSKGQQPISDATYHANMPPENFQSQVADMIGMWSGEPNQQPGTLTSGEKQQVAAAYAARGDWRQTARDIFDARKAASGENTQRSNMGADNRTPEIQLH